MRLQVSRASAEEQLVALLNEGYQLRRNLLSDYDDRRKAKIPIVYYPVLVLHGYLGHLILYSTAHRHIALSDEVLDDSESLSTAVACAF